MDNIQFDTDTYSNRPPRFQNEHESFLTKIAMKLGAKNQTQTQIVLIGIAAVAFLLTVIIIFRSAYYETKSKPYSPDKSISSFPVKI